MHFLQKIFTYFWINIHFHGKMLFGHNTLGNKENSPVLTKQLTQLQWKASYARYTQKVAQRRGWWSCYRRTLATLLLFSDIQCCQLLIFWYTNLIKKPDQILTVSKAVSFYFMNIESLQK